ncbi:MAG TPA: ATP-binding protein [Polyangia bacterium]|nr:ATP-binding protein [Polyangia bacterium]
MTEPHPHVLMVDDVEANLIALDALLAPLPCERVWATNGNEALRQLLRQEFAVLLLDVQMPDMDGYEVARLVRENPVTREVPIIFVTAMYPTDEGALRGYGSGAFDFLFKPINPDILRAKVQVFLDLFLSRRRLREEIAAHKRTVRELEAFSYSLSHDLRAPLRPLDGFSQLLLANYGDKLDPQAQHYLQRIRAGAQRMDQLISDLLRLSHLSKKPSKRDGVDLSALVAEIFDELRAADPERGAELVAEPEVVVACDPGLLRIALENLLRNAWKFTRIGGRGRIEFGRRSEGSATVYFVRDDGVGFDPDFAHKLFRPFQRLHRAADFEGTGIGLAIVERIITRHDGQIWAESTPGQGATFSFTLGTPAPARARRSQDT